MLTGLRFSILFSCRPCFLPSQCSSTDKLPCRWANRSCKFRPFSGIHHSKYLCLSKAAASQAVGDFLISRLKERCAIMPKTPFTEIVKPRKSCTQRTFGVFWWCGWRESNGHFFFLWFSIIYHNPLCPNGYKGFIYFPSSPFSIAFHKNNGQITDKK